VRFFLFRVEVYWFGPFDVLICDFFRVWDTVRTLSLGPEWRMRCKTCVAGERALIMCIVCLLLFEADVGAIFLHGGYFFFFV